MSTGNVTTTEFQREVNRAMRLIVALFPSDWDVVVETTICNCVACQKKEEELREVLICLSGTRPDGSLIIGARTLSLTEALTGLVALKLPLIVSMIEGSYNIGIKELTVSWKLSVGLVKKCGVYGDLSLFTDLDSGPTE